MEIESAVACRKTMNKNKRIPRDVIDARDKGKVFGQYISC